MFCKSSVASVWACFLLAVLPPGIGWAPLCWWPQKPVVVFSASDSFASAVGDFGHSPWANWRVWLFFIEENFRTGVVEYDLGALGIGQLTFWNFHGNPSDVPNTTARNLVRPFLISESYPLAYVPGRHGQNGKWFEEVWHTNKIMINDECLTLHLKQRASCPSPLGTPLTSHLGQIRWLTEGQLSWRFPASKVSVWRSPTRAFPTNLDQFS